MNLAKKKDQWLIDTSELKFKEKLGMGSSGVVHKGVWRAITVAIKQNMIFDSKEFLKEAELMKTLRPHKNIVQIYGVCIQEDKATIVMEFVKGGSLLQLLQQKPQLPLDQIIKIVKGTAAGMNHLHAEGIVHRDLAARNILLTETGEPKISDFGMSRPMGDGNKSQKTNTNIGPIRWMSPESLSSGEYSVKSDVWTFGIVIWEVMTGKTPHQEINMLEIGLLIRDKALTPKLPEDADATLKNICNMCWKKDPSQRPTFPIICDKLTRTFGED
jgi:serine/threonine protein kinase